MGYTAPVIRNIIFDWSGTLMNDLPAVWEATNYVFQRAGAPPMSLEQFRAEFCLPFTRFYDRFIPQVSLPQLEQWFHERFPQLQYMVTELPHARQFLEFCRGRGVLTFVLSSVNHDYYLAQAERAGLRQYLDHAYTGIWDKTVKIQEIIDTHRLAADETLLVGDMRHDIETARQGGIRSCAVLTGYSRRVDLEASEPDLMVENLDELQRLFEKNNMTLASGSSSSPAGEPHQMPRVTRSPRKPALDHG